MLHPSLIVLVAGLMLLIIAGCVRVTHRLPLRSGHDGQETDSLTPEECDTICRGLHALQQKNMGQRCALVQELKRQFMNREMPEELRQAEAICQEAGL